MRSIACFAILLVANACLAAPAEVLVDPTDDGLMSRVKNVDSTAEIVEHEGKKALKVTLGHDRPYPNITIAAPGGTWDLSAFESVEIDITNLSDESIKLGTRVDNAGANGRKNSTTGGVTLEPGKTETLRVEFNRKFATELRDSLAGMQYSPWGKRSAFGGAIDPAKVVKLNIFTSKPVRPYTFLIHEARATGEFDPATLTVPEPFFPFIDRYGQYVHKDWPEKIKSDADLAAAREKEAASIDSHPRPENWDRFGGWATGPKLEAKGHFYTTKHEGKWYLVDPEGHLFFSVGIDVVKAGGGTPIDKRDGWFADAPWDNEPAMAKYVSKAKPIRRGDYKGEEPRVFDFYRANLERKYGENAYETWLELTPKRLMNWGFNTIGNWSDAKLFENAQIPYAHWVYINAPKLPWQPGTRNRISDPFHDGFETELRRRTKGMTRGTTKDPYCIGYFVDNELSWGDETHLASGVIKGPAKQKAKQAFVDRLKEQYGEIGKLNAAWSMGYADWDAVLNGKAAPTSDQGVADLEAFNEVIVRRYFETVRRVVKEAAPDKLYLGCRFAESNPQVVRAAAEFCDVVSFNLYRDTVGAWAPPAEIDKPVIIGEFHFGATDAGVFGPGLVRARNQADRARKFRAYIASAASNPLIVGAHWFQLNDEATAGRVGDAENHNIGFVTIGDTPYIEMTKASREVAGQIYEIRSK